MIRRSFILAGLISAFLGHVPAASAVVGVVAPRSGPYSPLGAQILAGARAAADKTGDTLVEIDDACEESSGVSVGRRLADAKASVAIGFLCVETLSTALPVLKGAGIPAITVSVRSKILMEDAQRNGWPFFRMAPNEDDESERLSEVILQTWKAEPIAIIDDGTIYSRELADSVRQTLEPFGVRPVFNDTFRPGQEQQIALVRRIAKAGATHVLLGADRNDASIIARDAGAEKLPLTFMGGDALRAANRPVAMREGVLAVALPDYSSLPAAASVVSGLRERAVEPDGYTLPAYAAVQLAHQAASSAGEKPVLEIIRSNSFSTAIGMISFGNDHELRDNPYQLLQWRGNSFKPFDPKPE